MTKQEYAEFLEQIAVNHINDWLSEQDQVSLLNKHRMEAIVPPRAIMFIANIENDWADTDYIVSIHALDEPIPTLGLPQVDGMVVGHATLAKVMEKLQKDLVRLQYGLSDTGDNDVVGVTVFMETITNSIQGEEQFERAFESLQCWDEDGFLTEMTHSTTEQDGVIMLTLASDRVITDAGWINTESHVNMYVLHRDEAPVHLDSECTTADETIANSQKLERFMNAVLEPLTKNE